MSVKLKLLLATCFTSILLSGCTDSKDETVNGESLVAADTDQLKSIAVRSLGGQYDGNAEAITTVVNRNSEVGGTVSDVAVGGTDTFPEPVELDVEVEQSVQSIVAATLAVSESGDSTTNRDGNIITIDPDEKEICAEAEAEELLESDPSEPNYCEMFMRDVTVELHVTTEESGVVTYRYQNQDVIKLGYGEGSEYSEIDLGGMRTVLGYAELVGNDSDANSLNLPSVMTGSIRSTANITNETIGREAGSLSLDVINSIEIVSDADDGQTQFSLEPGNLFFIEADAQTGVGSLSFDVGALSIVAPSDQGLGRLNLGGYTAKADINPENGELMVSNFGLSKGPLSLSLDNTEILSMTLGAFGFAVTEGTDLEPGEVIIDGNMDLSVVLNNFTQLAPDADIVNLALNVMMPGGTTLYRAPNGHAAVGGVGPLSISYTATDAEAITTAESVTVNAGECFDFPSQGGSSSESIDTTTDDVDMVPDLDGPGDMVLMDFAQVDESDIMLPEQEPQDEDPSLAQTLNASVENCL